MKLCRNLRWKTGSRESSDPTLVQASLLRSQVPFSCLRTARPWGPDDDIAAPDCCDDTRECFERDPLSDRPPTIA